MNTRSSPSLSPYLSVGDLILLLLFSHSSTMWQKLVCFFFVMFFSFGMQLHKQHQQLANTNFIDSKFKCEKPQIWILQSRIATATAWVGSSIYKLIQTSNHNDKSVAMHHLHTYTLAHMYISRRLICTYKHQILSIEQTKKA